MYTAQDIRRTLASMLYALAVLEITRSRIGFGCVRGMQTDRQLQKSCRHLAPRLMQTSWGNTGTAIAEFVAAACGIRGENALTSWRSNHGGLKIANTRLAGHENSTT